MWIFLGFVLSAAFLTVFALVCHLHRARTRAKADRIIAGKVQTTVKEINHLIKILTSTDPWLVSRGIQDQLRITRLLEIRLDIIEQDH